MTSSKYFWISTLTLNTLLIWLSDKFFLLKKVIKVFLSPQLAHELLFKRVLLQLSTLSTVT